MSAIAEELMKVLDEASKNVAILTGMKAQFMDAGWDEKNAERVVIQLLANNNGNQANA